MVDGLGIGLHGIGVSGLCIDSLPLISAVVEPFNEINDQSEHTLSHTTVPADTSVMQGLGHRASNPCLASSVASHTQNAT